MNSKNGNRIESIIPDSPAHRAGLKPGDIVLSINDHPVHDEIDLMFYSKEPDPLLEIKREEKVLTRRVQKGEDEHTGIELKPFPIKRCRNHCAFCFVSQLPKGLRKSLYLRDDDYRMSFLYGNYITLTNLTDDDKERIVQQMLSPLYVSVHSTNGQVRNRLLGNKNTPDILKEIRFFTRHRIRLHTQIVLCPGVNDGEELEKTIKDLYRFYPYVSSIAVVPVGLTGHGRKGVDPLTKDEALRALLIIEKFQKKHFKKHGEAIVYGADELYLKAEKKFPPLKDYGELFQIENGVGMVPLFLQKAKRLRHVSHVPGSPVITFTGTSFFPFLEKFVSRFNKRYGTTIRVIQVENNFFGKTVTVTGLLTGRDIIQTLIGHIKGDEVLLIPDVILKDDANVLLDNITIDFIGEILNVKTKVIEATFDGLMKALEEID